MLIINFNAPKPKKKIPNFADKLLQEKASGILNWALMGLKELFEDIKNYGDIKLTNTQKNIVESLLDESDSLRYFLQDRIINKTDGDLSVTEIIDAYAEYCSTKNWIPKPSTIIKRELEALMFKMFGTAKVNSIVRDEKNTKGYRRVTLKD